MNKRVFTNIAEMPETSGIFNFSGRNGQSLFVGISENIKAEVKRLFSSNRILKTETENVEIIDADETNLINHYAETVRRKAPLYNLSLSEQNIYPHFKITNEKFPRLLATRRIERDAAEYFGAFLPRTGARFLLGFLIDAFRLRGCDIPIDGDYPVPCPQFYRKKCVAPCVAELCGEEAYLERVELTRLFLRDRRDELNEILLNKIEKFSVELDFESAARWRDLLRKIVDFQNDKNTGYRLDDAIDTFDIKRRNNSFFIYLVTQRKRKILGNQTFVYENKIEFSSPEVLGQQIWQFYRFHQPKEIVVSVDFPNRKYLEKVLSLRGGREVKISVIKKTKRKITTGRALRRTEFEYEFDNLKPRMSVRDFQNTFCKAFCLSRRVERIEAFDVAHISGSDFVGAKSVWENGRFLAEEYEFWFSDKKNEPEALADSVGRRFLTKVKLPDLILIDGGRAQLQAVLRNVERLKDSKISVISAVKPPRKHNEISHFLLEDGRSVGFEKNSDVFGVLLKLRDEAHSLANYIHRSKRETAHFYEVFYALPFLREKERYLLLRKFRSLKAVKTAGENELIEVLGETKGKAVFRQLKSNVETEEPFIVPIRYDEPNGEATDLQPLYLPKNQ